LDAAARTRLAAKLNQLATPIPFQFLPLQDSVDLSIFLIRTPAMEDVVEGHILDRAREKYSLHELAESRVGAVEEHLLVCDFCRARLDAIEPVNFIHFTADGPVYSRATRLTTGKVMARHWGKDMDGGKVFRSVGAAKRYLSASFAQMFPEHTCKGRCGPAQERGK